MFNYLPIKTLRLFLLLFISSISFTSSAQKQVLKLPSELYYFGTDKRSAFTMPNQDTSKFVLCLTDQTRIITHLINDDFQVISKLIIEKPQGKFRKLIGYFYSGQNYSIVFANKKRTRLHLVNFNFKKSDITHFTTEKIRRKREDLITSFSHNGKYFIMSASRKGQEIIFYAIDQEGRWEKNIVETPKNLDLNLKNVPLQSSSRHTFFSDELEQNPIYIEAVDIREELIPSLVKVYKNDNKIILTDDRIPSYTVVLSINMNDFSLNHSLYKPQNFHVCDFCTLKANSFYFNDTLFQIITTRKRLDLIATDMSNDEIITSFSAEHDSIINFLNTPLIFNQKRWIAKQESESVPKLLRKMNHYLPGISVYKENDKFYVTAGGYQKIPTYTTPMFPDMHTHSLPQPPALHDELPAPVYQPFLFGYYGTYSEEVHFQSIFDQNLIHIKGNKFFNPDQYYHHLNTYDRISLLENELKNICYAKTIFSFNNKKYFGYYNQEDLNYYLVEF